MSRRDDEQLRGMVDQDGGGASSLDGTPSQMEDMAAAVEARAKQIKAQVPQTPEQKIKDLDTGFLRQCLSHNRIGDAALWVTLFGDKYVWIPEWRKCWSGAATTGISTRTTGPPWPTSSGSARPTSNCSGALAPTRTRTWSRPCASGAMSCATGPDEITCWPAP